MTTHPLPHRLATHPRWRWALGMRLATGERIMRAELVAGARLFYAGCALGPLTAYDEPDLRDAATISAVAAQVGPWRGRHVDAGYEVTTVHGTYTARELGDAVALAWLGMWGDP